MAGHAANARVWIAAFFALLCQGLPAARVSAPNAPADVVGWLGVGDTALRDCVGHNLDGAAGAGVVVGRQAAHWAQIQGGGLGETELLSDVARHTDVHVASHVVNDQGAAWPAHFRLLNVQNVGQPQQREEGVGDAAAQPQAQR